jgi:PAS domain S-box-containing protein
MELIRRTGEHIPIDASSAPIRDEAGQVAGTVLVFRDISARRRAEEELAALEHRSRTILESISDGFILLDNAWRYSIINPAAERTMGRPAAELVGRSHWEEYPAIVGTQVEVLYKKAVAERIPVRFEYCYEPWDRWFDIAAYPSSEGLSVYFRDITERKRAEAALLRLNEDLKQFTYAATHDVREPLRMITVYAQMLERKLGTDGDGELKDYLSHIVIGAKRIGRLIDGLLEYSRVGELESTPPTSVDTQIALQEALDDLQIAISESKAEVASVPLPRVLADHVHVRQLFQNLIGNALKYRQRNSTPKISIRTHHDAESWIFSVKDSGIGIDSAHHEKIFVPFKRLHNSEVAGVGIGLATCKRIVERYNGRIWVESQPGNGATFYFSLPAAEEGAHVG